MGHGHGANEPELGKALSALRAGDLDAADAIARPFSPHAQRSGRSSACGGHCAAAGRDRASRARGERKPGAAPRSCSDARSSPAGRRARRQTSPPPPLSFRRAMALAPERADAAFCACVTLLNAAIPEAQRCCRGCLRNSLMTPRAPGPARPCRSIAKGRSTGGGAGCARASGARRSGSVALHLQRGMLLEFLDRRVDAIAAYRAATDMAPDNADALLKLGVLRPRRCADTGAAAVLERAVGCDQGSADAWFALALVRQDQRNFAAAAGAIGALLMSSQISPRPRSTSAPAIRKRAMSAWPEGELPAGTAAKAADVRPYRPSLGDGTSRRGLARCCGVAQITRRLISGRAGRGTAGDRCRASKAKQHRSRRNVAAFLARVVRTPVRRRRARLRKHCATGVPACKTPRKPGSTQTAGNKIPTSLKRSELTRPVSRRNGKSSRFTGWVANSE